MYSSVSTDEHSFPENDRNISHCLVGSMLKIEMCKNYNLFPKYDNEKKRIIYHIIIVGSEHQVQIVKTPLRCYKVLETVVVFNITNICIQKTFSFLK